LEKEESVLPATVRLVVVMVVLLLLSTCFVGAAATGYNNDIECLLDLAQSIGQKVKTSSL
jgi:hypothetical protein